MLPTHVKTNHGCHELLLKQTSEKTFDILGLPMTSIFIYFKFKNYIHVPIHTFSPQKMLCCCMKNIHIPVYSINIIVDIVRHISILAHKI